MTPIWQPIETAEALGPQELVLLFEPHDDIGFMFVGCKNASGQWYNNLDFADQKPTHWAHLPQMPEQALGSVPIEDL